MRRLMKYQCEVCGIVYSDIDDARACEAKDYGLTLKEYDEWGSLCEAAARAGKRIGVHKCPETDAAFDAACEALAAFETAHGLGDRKKPFEFLL